ncbi:ABC transporter substrate-binding protein [Natronorarus salvus]|uniref:ABC transporter substrate-binding protein n=1 Tax=Natronorarus salvus TaxID=3117733 RepID=UPI002F264FDB
MNVVSTSPSGTEILCALGVEPVAVSHSCDYPPRVRDLPVIDRSRVDGGSSGERHRRTIEVSADGHVYEIDLETLEAVEPDLVVSQEVCGVCAVDTTLIEEVLTETEIGPEVVGMHADRFEDLFSCIREVSVAVDREDEAEELIGVLRERAERIEAETAELDSPRVVVVEWMDPLVVAGRWVPDLVSIAGGEYGLAMPGESAAKPSWEAFREYDPEVIVVTPCGYSVRETVAKREELFAREGWEEVSAVRSGDVYAMDGASYLTRWTPRLVDALERLVCLLHPDTFGEPPRDVVALRDTLATGPRTGDR